MPQEIVEKIAACRNQPPSKEPQEEQDERVKKQETLKDIATERLRLTKKEAVAISKAQKELEAAKEAAKKGQELRQLKIKEAETAYKLQLEAIKTDFDAGDEVKRKKVETATVNLENVEKAHREALENLEKLQAQMAGKQQAEEAEDLYGEKEPAFDGCGAIVDPFSSKCQVQTELAQLAPTVPKRR